MSTDTRIREGAAKAGVICESTMVGGLLRYVIDGEEMTPGEAVARYGQEFDPDETLMVSGDEAVALRKAMAEYGKNTAR